ncbi:MAG TPA: L,D-transpeptidase family protein [Pontiella sp.]
MNLGTVGSSKRQKGGRWKRVLIVMALLHAGAIAVYLYFSNNDKNTTIEVTEPAIAAPLDPVPLAPVPIAPVAIATPQTQAVLSDARSFIEAGQLNEAKTTLDKLVASTPDAEAIELLGKVNMELLKSPRMMPGKEYYSIQSGDYLQKIAKKYNTTVSLIKTINGMTSDTIRLGARLLVYSGNFSIHVSKTKNTLDLMAGEKLFKRYSVGTGKFGKTPAVEFSIVDKIVEPPWTRFSDGKQIEYGDPENVLGTRWMAIKSDTHPEITGFGIHGTWDRDSIGKQSSAGCVRMLNEDVEELFDLVPRQTTVIITE